MNKKRGCAVVAVLLAAMSVLSCTEDKPVDPEPTDTTPPAAITDLNINCVTSGSVELTWTAPGDDGMAGRATSYDIRYHTDQIDSVTWKVATACLAECVPREAGASESFVVTGLNPSTPYFFAIRATDESSNRGGISNSAHTQTHDANIVTWARNYGGPYTEGGGGNVQVVPTPDGGYVLGGETKSYGDNSSSFYFLKVDEYGNQLWHSWYGYPRANIPHGFATTPDGGYIMAGFEGDISMFDDDIYVVKVDGSGNLVWERTYGDPTIDITDYGSAVAVVPGGGYVVGGETVSVDPEGGCLLRIDESGEIIWWKTYPGGGTPSCVVVTTDGGFLTAGLSVCGDVFCGGLIRADESGNLLWSKAVETAMILYSMVPARDGGYIIAGYTHGISDAYIVKIDDSGNPIWEKTYGGTANDMAYSVCRAHCGGYIVAGWTATPDSDDPADVWIFKIDESGNMLWERTYGGPLSDGARSVAPTSDGGYIVGGKTASFGNGQQFWILKVDDEGRLAE
jgi:hypothetical protein